MSINSPLSSLPLVQKMEVNITRKDGNTEQAEDGEKTFAYSSVDSAGRGAVGFGDTFHGPFSDVSKWNNQMRGPLNH
jgi:hypothetical protein